MTDWSEFVREILEASSLKGGEITMIPDAFEDPMTELRTGQHYGVFVDETGLSGLDLSESNIPRKRKYWVGIIIAPGDMKNVMARLDKELDDFCATEQKREFHAKDIFAGKGIFAGISMQARLNILNALVNVFTDYNIRILVQIIDPDEVTSLLADLQELLGEEQPRKVYRLGERSAIGFQFHKLDDAALYLLLQQVKMYIDMNRPNEKYRARVVVDEGWQRDGANVASEIWASTFVGATIHFRASSFVTPLQLADFAAWTLNRWQLLQARLQAGKSLDYYNKRLYVIPSPMVLQFEGSFMEPVKIEVDLSSE